MLLQVLLGQCFVVGVVGHDSLRRVLHADTANAGANSASGSTVREKTEYTFAFCTVALDLLPEPGGDCDNVARPTSAEKRPTVLILWPPFPEHLVAGDVPGKDSG